VPTHPILRLSPCQIAQKRDQNSTVRRNADKDFLVRSMSEQAHHDREDETESEDDDGHAGATHRRQQEQDDGDEEDEDGEEDHHEASEGVDAGCGVEGYGRILSLVLLRAAFEEVLKAKGKGFGKCFV